MSTNWEIGGSGTTNMQEQWVMSGQGIWINARRHITLILQPPTCKSGALGLAKLAAPLVTLQSVLQRPAIVVWIAICNARKNRCGRAAERQSNCSGLLGPTSVIMRMHHSYQTLHHDLIMNDWRNCATKCLWQHEESGHVLLLLLSAGSITKIWELTKCPAIWVNQLF